MQNIADVYRDSKAIQNLDGQAAFKRDRHRMGEAVRSKVTSIQAMLTETHPLRDAIATVLDTEMIAQIVTRLGSYYEIATGVMNESLRDAMDKLVKSTEEATSWVATVPDLEKKETEFAKMLKTKKGMDMGVKLMKKVEEQIAAGKSIADDLDGDIAEEYDQIQTKAQNGCNDIQTIATLNALLAVLRNPQIRATEGASLRVMLKDCMDQFDEDGSALAGLCPAKLRKEAMDILEASQSSKPVKRLKKSRSG